MADIEDDLFEFMDVDNIGTEALPTLSETPSESNE